MDPEQLAALYQGAYNDPMPPEEDGSVQDTSVVPAAPPEPDMWDRLAEAAGVIPRAVAALPPPGPRSVSDKVGAAYSGMNEGKFGRMQKRGSYERGVDQAKQEEYAKAKALADQYETANKGEQEDNQKVADAQLAYGDAQATGMLDIARLNNQAAREEQAAVENARAEADKAKADFAASLADFRAQRVRPGALLDSMSSGQRFATLLSAAVTDYLGVQGIKSSAMEILQKNIDRNIDAQIQNIHQKGEVVQGFKDLWEMQRSQSATDAEARSRVKAFVLQSAKDELEGNLAKFEGGLAAAKTQAAMAHLNTELVKTVQDVYAHADDNAFRTGQQLLTKRGQDIQASMEQKRLDMEQKKLDAMKGGGGPDSKLLETVVRDPTGKVLGFAGDKERAAAVQQKNDATYRAVDILDKSIDLVGKTGRVYDYLGKTIVQGVDEAQLRSLYSEWVEATTLAYSGKVANKDEAARIQSIVPFQSWAQGLMSGDGGQIMSKVAGAYGGRSLDQLEAENRSNLRPPSEDEAKVYQGGTADSETYDAYKTKFGAITNGNTGQVRDDTDRLIANIDTPKAGNQPADEIPTSAAKDWEVFADATGRDLHRPPAGQVAREPMPAQPVWAVNMSRARDQIRDFSDDDPPPADAPPTKRDRYEKDRDEAKRALEALVRWATPSGMDLGISTDSDAKDKETYAQLMLHSLNLDDTYQQP